MNDDRLTRALGGALLALRVTLGLFLLQWGVEKFVVPENTVGIWQHFYGLSLPLVLGYLSARSRSPSPSACSSACTGPPPTVRRWRCTQSACWQPGASFSTPGATR